MSQFYDNFMKTIISQSSSCNLARREYISHLSYFILDAKPLDNSTKGTELRRTSFTYPL
ncbi:hypothetical protein Xmir_02936 [Xenorhabdus miraniensis]|uniref:Uncharacterized protein n=1 Tax=Xenorhabdus miraniensis TaxID=351674 RepID=A0A2D0JNG7_9GAMM|nr:hypothetical protein Xmir_02936 [Xenorhabdus miraniensis]